MIRPIHPGLAPNLEKEDFLIVLTHIFQFWKYNEKRKTVTLEKWFEKKYQTNAFAFNSGRGALYAILTNLSLKKGDEVLVTGFTCVAVIDAIIATGAKPIYVDIQKDFTLDIVDLQKKTTSKAKVLILQHTFGIADLQDKVFSFCKEKNISIIEDVAHGVGLSQSNTLLGKRGLAAIFSFGRDKAFSSVSGGIAITSDKKLSERLLEYQKKQSMPSLWWTFQNLFHTVSFYTLILPLYDFFSLGKVFLVAFQKCGLLGKPIDKDELHHFSLYTRKLPSPLSYLILSQLERMERFNAKREEYVRLYKEKLVGIKTVVGIGSFLRFPLLVDNPLQLKKVAKKEKIYLGDWYSNQIDPKGTDKVGLFYEEGSCPTAEYVADHIVNLPTYPTLAMSDAEKVATIVNTYVTHSRNTR